MSRPRSRDITCPECRQDLFRATSTWYRIGGDGNEWMRRSRTCRACGYTDNETVPMPIRDRDEVFPDDTASPGNSPEDPLE